MSRHIAPCPYCGNEKPCYTADYRPKFLYWGRFACHECGVTGPWGDGIREAIKRRNDMPRKEGADGDR
ncbi:hypothetical protein AAK967_02320 [Atopobiaceae bacterium 24-176]